MYFKLYHYQELSEHPSEAVLSKCRAETGGTPLLLVDCPVNKLSRLLHIGGGVLVKTGFNN